MRSFLFLFLSALWAFGATPTTDIKVDQVGYGPAEAKVALVVAKAAAGEFTVRRASDNAVAFKGTLAAPQDDPESGDRVQAADFSRLAKEGKYYLDVPGVGRSWDFAIGKNAFARAWYLAMRSFYAQRCGIAVDLGPEFPGYKHAVCHLDGAYHASSGKTGPVKPSGGWHDAGDYGRYIVNSGITTGTLLWTYEMFAPRVGKLKLDIPESGNGTPDILNEIKWNLDWMLSMQDSDGGVFHKQTSERFCDFIMPEKDTLVSYVIGTGKEPFKSSCATADFAAVMAVAARVYKPFNPAYAARCLDAAKAAWAWVEKNPAVLFRNPRGISTGEYGDGKCGDEILWASAELWRTTKDAAYARYFADHQAEFLDTVRAVAPEGWNMLAPLGLWTYVLADGPDAGIVGSIRKATLAAADEIVERTSKDGYRVSMTARDYVWGSNGVVANYGMQLLVANAVKRDPRYVQAALDNLHYLLGRNPFSLSYVTAVGENPFLHPHHRPSGADQNEKPWPGLLSGGPNRGRQDPVARKLPADVPPMKAYVDDQGSYGSNENAINWNAPLVFLLSGALPAK